MARQTYPLTVKKKIQESSSACTLVLTPREEDKSIFSAYKPAQFLSFHLTLENQKIVRSYSLSSSPLLGEELTTTVKKVKQGKASSYLVDQLKEGDVVQSTRPQGKFFKPLSDLKPRRYFMIGGGSGITPLFSIIKTVLSCDEQNQVILVYCNRSENAIIYQEELEKWKQKHPQRLQIIHILSQPADAVLSKFSGRLSSSSLKEILNQHFSHFKNIECYLCGPSELMKMTIQVLKEHEIDSSCIHKESFGSPQKKQSVVSDSALVVSSGSCSPMEGAGALSAVLDGQTIQISSEPDVSILEQLISAGHCPPFSCMEGNCMTCMAVLKKGKIYQDGPGILDEENISAKEILTCQAKPLSSIIEVDYDS